MAAGGTVGKDRTRPSGMRALSLLSAGQTVSLLGSGMTGFGLVIWAYLTIPTATTLALASLFRFAPTVLFSPFAGAFVDRWNRRLTMMLSDLAAGAATVVLLVLLVTGRLEVWHWYVAGAFAGVFESFQFPAFSAAITQMVPKEQYGRASGMLSTAQSASGIFAPVFAGALLGVIGTSAAAVERGLTVIMLIDMATFATAVGILLVIAVPGRPPAPEGPQARASIWSEAAFGFRFIAKRRSLLGLQLVFFLINFVATLGFVVLAAMILARTGNDSLVLGSVESAAAIGGVAGGVSLSVWGGPKRRVHGVLGGMALEGVLGGVLMGVGRSLYLWAPAAFFGAFFIPLINGSNQAIWQSKVPPAIQGKVFAARRLIAQITAPIAMAISGPLADGVFEPGMRPGGSLASAFGWLVGTGPGAGIALMLVIFGIASTLVGLCAYGVRVIRDAETLLPDHDAAPRAA